MKKRIGISLLIASILLLGACGNSEAGKGSKGGNDSSKGSQKMIVSTFGLSEDVVKKDVIAPFEKEEDAAVTLEVGNSSDRFTKLKNNPKSDIDAIELSQNHSVEGNNADLFLKVTEKEVPNLAQLTDGAKQVFESGAGVPFTINSIGIIYDKEKTGKEIKDWSDLWDKDLKGKISVPDITATGGPLFMYAASDYKNQDITKDNGKKAFAAMKELKPNVVKTYSKSSDLANMFQSGEISVAVVPDFAVDVIQGANDMVDYVVPEKGSYANFNTINIPKNTKNKKLAYAYINYRISKDAQKRKALSLNEGPINKEVKLSEDEAKNKTYGDIEKRSKPVDFKFINKNMTDWIDQWNKLMNQ